MTSFSFSCIVNVGFTVYVFGIHMNLKWLEIEKYEKKESADYFFPSRLFFILVALSLSCFSPQWLFLTSSPNNLKKPTELLHYDICLNRRAGWNTLLSVFSCPLFTSWNVHQPVFFFSFFYIRCPACVSSITSLPSPLRYLDSCGWMCVFQRLWPWHLV